MILCLTLMNHQEARGEYQLSGIGWSTQTILRQIGLLAPILSIIVWVNKHPFSVEPTLLGGQQPFSILSAILG